MPSLSFIDLTAAGSLLTSACAVAALAALESLMCATVADGMSIDGHHDPDKGLFGQGLANVAAPLFGGIPATAAIARTADNVRAGAASRLASVSHSLVLLVVIFAAAPLVSDIPLAALAGVLFATCVRMVETGSILALLRSTRADALIVTLTFTITVAVDLVTAVGVGLGVAVVLALRTVARSAHLELVPLESGDHTAEEHALISEHIVAYRLDGPLLFAAAHRLLLELADVADVHVVILGCRESAGSMPPGPGSSVTPSPSWNDAGSSSCSPASRLGMTKSCPPSASGRLFAEKVASFPTPRQRSSTHASCSRLAAISASTTISILRGPDTG